MYISNVKVTGTCDGERCNKPAKYWFGQTSMAHCGNAACENHLGRKWQECYDRIEQEDRERLEEEFNNTPIQGEDEGW